MRIIIIGFLTFLISCGAPIKQKDTISVACASNMQFAMDSIAVLFEAEHNIKCIITTASTGMLTAQIENGAPFDVFLSANINYPETIYKNGNGSKPFVYAKGRLLLVVNNQSTYTSIIQVLNDPNIKRIGIANDKTAPYGMAASQYLQEIGKMEGLKKRIIRGESIGQINQYITTGAVDAAFTSYSFKVKNKNKFSYLEVDPAYFEPINQAIMILKHGNENNFKASNELLNFFSKEKCKSVLNYYGYLTE